MRRSKSNLSFKSRNARRASMRRKMLTPEQLEERRKKIAAHSALKRSQETPEEHATRIRRQARERRQRRSCKLQKEKQLRQQAIVAAIEKRHRKNTENEIEQIQIAERQLARGECIVKKLQRKLKDQTEDNIEGGAVCGTVSNNQIIKREFCEIDSDTDPIAVDHRTLDTQELPLVSGSKLSDI